jgi:hypothetical protein
MRGDHNATLRNRIALMSTKYISIEEAAKRAGKDDFLRKVKSAIIPRLIQKGLLNGKKDKKKQLVADDDALAKVLQSGIESFVQDQQGYSFMVVRAPIEKVGEKLKTRKSVAKYEPNIKPLKMRQDIGAQPDEKRRHTFLVQMKGAPDWTALIQTVHWFYSCDAIMVTALAAAMSKEFKTLAASSWDDDFSGSSLIICENGEQKAAISDEDEDGSAGYYDFFYENGISLAESFIEVDKSTSNLYVADPKQVLRADHVELKVPKPVESKGPHVAEKLGMMAQAIAGDFDDEEAFMNHMRGGIWEQAQAILKAGF